jgi:chromosome segregation ATPase
MVEIMVHETQTRDHQAILDRLEILTLSIDQIKYEIKEAKSYLGTLNRQMAKTQIEHDNALIRLSTLENELHELQNHNLKSLGCKTVKNWLHCRAGVAPRLIPIAIT